jgi:hypothetical protein
MIARLLFSNNNKRNGIVFARYASARIRGRMLLMSLALLSSLTYAVNWSDVWQAIVDFFTHVQWTRFTWILCAALLVSALVILLVTFFVNNSHDRQYFETIKEETSTIRVYRIDAPRNSVRYFNLSDLKLVKTVTLEDFYHSFPIKEQGRVKEWISEILDGKVAPQYLQTDVIFHQEKREVPSFLKISKADPSKGLVHLESYLLRYDGNEKLTSSVSHFSTEGDFAQAMKANGVQTGITFCFALLPVKVGNQALSDAELKAKITPEAALRFRNAVAPYVTGNQKLIQASDNELVVANFDMLETSQAINFALRVVNGANRAFQNGHRRHEIQYEVRSGIVQNKDLLGDSDAILQEARRAASSAYDTTSVISFYKKGAEDFDQNDIMTFRSEVERIIYEKRLVYTYRPIFNCDKCKVNGFLARATPLNTSFASIEELKNYAVRAKDDKNLFAAIAKNLVPRFVNERDNKTQKLYYPVRMQERSLLVPFFSHFRDAQEANLVFLFAEEDVAVNVDAAGLSRFIETLNEIHEAGFEVAILLSGKTLLLDSKIYEKCDAFFVDFAQTSEETNMDTKIRVELHALVEKLLHYNKPIVANSLMSWTALELVVSSGIAFISSDVFAPYDAMFKPLNERNLERMKAMKERK